MQHGFVRRAGTSCSEGPQLAVRGYLGQLVGSNPFRAMVVVPCGGAAACAEAEGGALQKKKRIHRSWVERGRKEKRRDRSKLNEKRRADRAAKRAEKLQVHAAIPLMKSPQAPECLLFIPVLWRRRCRWARWLLPNLNNMHHLPALLRPELLKQMRPSLLQPACR